MNRMITGHSASSSCCLLLAILALSTAGCADELASMRPVFLDRYFPEKYDATTGAIVKPAERIDEIRALGENARSQSPAEQQPIATALAKQIQREQDPLVRRAIIRSLSNFQTPMAGAVIAAGLNDPDRDVRIASCEEISEHRSADAASRLTQVLERDNSVDVRIAAIRGLGALKDAASLPRLVPALESRDPAVQLAAIDAARAIRRDQGGEDLGGDVNAWIAFAQGRQPTIASQPAPSAPLQWARRLVPGWN
jgi:HEAT repeat protein